MAKIYISLGTNIDPINSLSAGITALQTHLDELVLSSVYESEAVGFTGENFLNMVVGAQTSLSITDLVKLFKQIEMDNGRTPESQKFAPRTLDLDLLLYDDQVCSIPIELPRAEILDNAFVLWPLAEIAANQSHPINGQTYGQLWQAYDKAQKLWPVDFSWSSKV